MWSHMDELVPNQQIGHGGPVKRFSNIKFHENPPSGNRVVSCGQIDKHDKANCCCFFSFSFANMPKNGSSLSSKTFTESML
jgi:hypothetical protein